MSKYYWTMRGAQALDMKSRYGRAVTAFAVWSLGLLTLVTLLLVIYTAGCIVYFWLTD